METATGENGNGQQTQVKTIFGVPCEGCTNRAQIMGAGDWKVDAIILGSIVLLTVCIILYKNSLVSID